MQKAPFLGLGKPKLVQSISPSIGAGEVMALPIPPRVILMVKGRLDSDLTLTVKSGDELRTGQQIVKSSVHGESCFSTVTGVVKGLSAQEGYLEQFYTVISVETTGEDKWDQSLPVIDGKAPIETVLPLLARLPGGSELGELLQARTRLETLLLNGLDGDMLVSTQQCVLTTQSQAIKDGLQHLKTLFPSARLILAVPPALRSIVEGVEVDVTAVEPFYPQTLPRLVAKNLLKKVVPAYKKLEEAGLGVLNVEAVASLGALYATGRIPFDKLLTLVDQNLKSRHVKVRMGTTVATILDHLGIETRDGDRILLGGPMRGQSIYSLDTPVLHDTDAIMVQDREQVSPISDTPCVNCGKCVRTCPVNIPVNMLVRLLENGLYEDAAREYDLLFCIECGLCAYVCVARIPIFHYIMLGKSEVARKKAAEGTND
jgi:Na+-translocating ferredoxin:NAD+ oxidoreductase subunit C